MMKEAERLLERMVEKNLKLDIITFGTIIKGYMSHGLVDHALAIYRKHFCEADETTRLVPNEVIFNTLLDGCVKNNRLDLALNLFHEIISINEPGSQHSNYYRSQNINFAPSHFTLTIAIKMYGRLRAVEKAIELVKVWPRKYNIQLNNHVFTCLLSALLNNNWYQEALKIPRYMKDAKIKPDARTYGTLVSGLLRSNNYADSEQAYKIVVGAFKDGPGVEYDTFLRICKMYPKLFTEASKNAWTHEAKSVIHRTNSALYSY